jgi:hypothetical protein
MASAHQASEEFDGMLFVAGLSKYFFVDDDDRIRAKHGNRGFGAESTRDVVGLLGSQALGQLGGRFTLARELYDCRRLDLEGHASARQDLSPAWRGAR